MSIVPIDQADPPATRVYFLDTTAVVKLFVREPGSEWLQRELAGRLNVHLQTSQMAQAEALGVLKREWIKDTKAAETEDQKLQAFKKYHRRIFMLYRGLPGNLRIKENPLTENDQELWKVLRELKPGAELDVVDVTHAGLFETDRFLSSISGRSGPWMVTSDRRLIDYCRTKGILVVDPEEEEKKQQGGSADGADKLAGRP